MPHCPWLDVDKGIGSDRGGTFDMDDGGVNVGNDGGIINQLHWAKESSNVGLQPLNQPTRESTLKEALYLEIGDVPLG